jgi:hypothetical protein
MNQKDMNKFLSDKITENKDCPDGTTFDRAKNNVKEKK